MDITYIPPERQGILLLYSLIFGYLSGFICGTAGLPVDILKKLLSKKKKICIIIDISCDIIASIVNIIAIIVFIYAANEGYIRYFLLLFTVIGILLYKISFGKLYSKLAEALSGIIYRICVLIIKKIRKLIYPVKAGIKSSGVLRYIKKELTTARRR